MVKQSGSLDCNEPWRMEWRGLVGFAAVLNMTRFNMLRIDLVTL